MVSLNNKTLFELIDKANCLKYKGSLINDEIINLEALKKICMAR